LTASRFAWTFLVAWLLAGCAPESKPLPLKPVHVRAPDHSSITLKPTKKSVATARPGAAPEAIIDSDMSLGEALAGSNSPAKIRDRQRLVDVSYYSFDKKLHHGQVLIDEDLVADVKSIFAQIEKSRFPISKVVPVCRYGWSDDSAVAADNSSGFNYRPIPETRTLSQHAFGRAIDINPAENPYYDPRKPTNASYDPNKSGTLTASSPPTRAFLAHGWNWGGFWKRDRDYQHFEK
jgi:hypothetical protein